jgi:hypothetical protein
VVSKLQSVQVRRETNAGRVAGREERCERRRRIQKQGSAGQQMQVGMKRQVRMDGSTGHEGGGDDPWMDHGSSYTHTHRDEP